MNATSDQFLAFFTLALLAIGVKMMFRDFKVLRMENTLRGNRPLLNAGDEQRAIRNYQLAIELTPRQEFKEALRFLNEAEVQLASSGINNLPLLSGILNQQALCLLRGGEGGKGEKGRIVSYRKASTKQEILELTGRSVNLAKLSGNEKAILDALFTKASVLESLGMLSETADCLRQSLELAKSIYGKQSEEEGRLLNNLGHTLLKSCRYGESLKCYAEALTILERRTGRDSSLTAEARLGQVEALKGMNGY
jgi:tetratricopeptide (TPR) repeat protein